jgi:hypothetical protein
MAVYKVPQDVEAEDKLIGPFSFRQFIYLIIAAIGILLAWGLSRIFVGLLVIPLPIIAFFLIIALPLRKDQPMETYLAAVVRFYLKPRQRLWVPEGTISLVNITAPKVVERQLTKGFSGEEASQQLSYLAEVVDTQGWSTRGVIASNQAMNDIVTAEAQTAVDILDENTEIAQSFEQRIAQTDEARKKAMVEQFHMAIQKPAAPQSPTAAQPAAKDDKPSYDPYPSDIQQKVIKPADEPTATTTSTPVPSDDEDKQKTSEQPSLKTVSPDIMRLANNNDLSISTLAHEAHRLQDEEEVEISLR